ncbi:MAG: hypothetical protein WC850_04060 [Candidatus Gracilibacteria bacterium]
MKDSNNNENIDTEEIVNDTENEIVVEEEKSKIPNIPPVAKYTRPPAFQKGNNFAKGNQNNRGFQQVQRRAAGRGR